MSDYHLALHTRCTTTIRYPVDTRSAMSFHSITPPFN